MSAISSAATTIARLATMRMEYAGESREVALNGAAQGFIDSASDAHARRGGYRLGEITSERMEDIDFHASVARDILDGQVSRPSTGIVRDYALSLI